MAVINDRRQKLPVLFNGKSGTSHILLCHTLLPYSMGQTSPAQILETPLPMGEWHSCTGRGEFMPAIFGVKLPQDF